ncbi:hypothetical protein PSV08DRAFT_355673 [Bipolaris maydis]|uniref:uncharacterized protein n=1 Tax=Cochliobolus heterostrophus TaxID=5016 RepID=UPI0024D09A1B|nr:hypothetical protein PSV08DRAFT_355673 [Bipolaris maydis]
MQNTALPSWVPDWLAHDITSAAVLSIIRKKPFNASKGKPPIIIGNITSFSKSDEDMRTGEKETATIESAETVNGPSTIGGAMGIALEETLFQWFQWYNDSARTPAPESLAFSRDILADVSSLPAQEVRDALVKAYFDNVHRSFPIISQSAFMDSYSNPQNPPHLLLFQALLFAGAHSCTHPLVAEDCHAVKSVLFRRASMLYHLRRENDRAQLIQAPFLFTWHVSDGDTVASGPWYWSGVAARVGCGLGAHRKKEVTNLHLPGAVSSDLDPRLHLLNRMLELALIGVDVLSANAPPRTEPVDVGKITTRLAVWALQAGLSTASTDHDDSISCLLRIHYNLMLSYFHRTLSTSASSQKISIVSAHGILISFKKLATMGCIAQCAFTGVGAATAVGYQTVNDICTTIGKGGHLVAIESINRLSRLSRLLERMAEYWPNAESVLTVFQRLHNECTWCIS